MLTLMFTTMAASLLTANPVLRIAAPPLSGLEVSEKTAAFHTEHLAQQLAAAGAKVVTPREIAAVLGLERQRQLLGCNEGEGSCVVELAGALGVDAILVGDVAKVGTRYQVNLKLISATNAERVATWSARSEGDEALLDELSRAGRRMAVEAAQALQRSLEPRSGGGTESRSGWGRANAWIPAAVGAVGAGLGAFAAWQADTRYRELTGTLPLTETRAGELRAEGNVWKQTTWAGFGVGAAGLLAGALLWSLGGDDSVPSASAALLPGGAAISFTWEVP